MLRHRAEKLILMPCNERESFKSVEILSSEALLRGGQHSRFPTEFNKHGFEVSVEVRLAATACERPHFEMVCGYQKNGIRRSAVENRVSVFPKFAFDLCSPLFFFKISMTT